MKSIKRKNKKFNRKSKTTRKSNKSRKSGGSSSSKNKIVQVDAKYIRDRSFLENKNLEFEFIGSEIFIESNDKYYKKNPPFKVIEEKNTNYRDGSTFDPYSKKYKITTIIYSASGDRIEIHDNKFKYYIPGVGVSSCTYDSFDIYTSKSKGMLWGETTTTYYIKPEKISQNGKLEVVPNKLPDTVEMVPRESFDEPPKPTNQLDELFVNYDRPDTILIIYIDKKNYYYYRKIADLKPIRIEGNIIYIDEDPIPIGVNKSFSYKMNGKGENKKCTYEIFKTTFVNGKEYYTKKDQNFS